MPRHLGMPWSSSPSPYVTAIRVAGAAVAMSLAACGLPPPEPESGPSSSQLPVRTGQQESDGPTTLFGLDGDSEPTDPDEVSGSTCPSAPGWSVRRERHSIVEILGEEDGTQRYPGVANRPRTMCRYQSTGDGPATESAVDALGRSLEGRVDLLLPGDVHTNGVIIKCGLCNK